MLAERTALNMSTYERKLRGYKCAECNSVDFLEAHHIVSLKAGGSNSIENIIIL